MFIQTKIAEFFVNNNIEFNLTYWYLGISIAGLLLFAIIYKVFDLSFDSYSTKSADKYHKKVDWNGYYIYPPNGHIVPNMVNYEDEDED